MYCFFSFLVVMVTHVVVVEKVVVGCQAYTNSLGGRGPMYCFFPFLVAMVMQGVVVEMMVVEHQAYSGEEVEYLLFMLRL